MIYQRVIITSITISRPRQVSLFQLKIPREVKDIIGVETSVKWTSGDLPKKHPADPWTIPMGMSRNYYLGDLKLQSLAKANIFYRRDIALDNNIDNADFTSRWLVPQLYTHQIHHTEDEVNLSGITTVLQGFYRDYTADQIAGNYGYTLKVYIWLQLKED